MTHAAIVNSCRRTILTLLVGFGFVMSVLSNAESSEPVEKLTLATSWRGGATLGWAQVFADRVKQLTNGEVEVEVFPGGTLGSPLKVAETVRNGVADMGHTFISYEYGRDKTVVMFAGRPGGLNAELMIHWLDQGGGRDMWREYRMETADVVAFPCGMVPREGGMFSSRKIRTLADFDGLKLRTAGAWSEIAAEMGVSTVVLSGGEVYQALERGLVDAVEWSTLSLNRSMGFHKIAPYIVLPGFHQSTGLLECSINKEVWNRLSDHNREMIALAAVIETDRTYRETGHRDAEAYAFFKDAGIEFVTVEDEVLARVDELIEAWEDKTAAELGGWFAKALESQRDYQALWNNAHEYRESRPPR